MSAPLLENSWIRLSKNISTAQFTKLGLILLICWCLVSVARMFVLALSTNAPASAKLTSASLETLPQIDSTHQLSVNDIEQLKAIHLFGSPLDKSEVTVVKTEAVSDEELNAAKTRLDLKLLGVMYSLKQQEAVAVIVHKKRQDHYSVGMKLPVSGQVEVARIFEDRIILSNNGRYEALWLYSEDQKEGGLIAKAAEPSVSNTVVNQKNRGRSAPNVVANSYRQALYKSPETLKDAIRISPATINGKMIGYRLSPGKRAKDFALLGFKTNDIVTQINNVQLDGPKKAMELYQLMETAKQASLTIQRGDQSIELQLDLGGDNS